MTGADLLGGLIDLASAGFLAAGGFFYVVGMIGMNRMPDLFTRMHATSVSETLGLSLLFLGMALQAGFTLVLVKLVVIFALIMLTAPTAAHALARAALHEGVRPVLEDDEGRLVETDPGTLFPGLEERLETPLVSETAELVGEDAAGIAPVGGVGGTQPSNS